MIGAAGAVGFADYFSTFSFWHDMIMIMTVPIQIKNPDVVRDIRLLAELTHQPITDVVAEAVRIKLAEAQRARAADIADRLRRVAEIQERIAALPRMGPPLTDADFYDEDGFPICP